MGQDSLVHHLETMALEEIRAIGEGENPVKPQADGFGKARFDELASDSPALVFLLDDQERTSARSSQQMCMAQLPMIPSCPSSTYT